jgi:hypothetical protein
VRLRPPAIWGAVAAVLATVAIGAMLGAAGGGAWSGNVVQAGLRLYARLADAGRQLHLGFLLPVIAVTVSFHIGTRAGHRLSRRSEARAVVAPHAPVVRYTFLFCLSAVAMLVWAASEGLLP